MTSTSTDRIEKEIVMRAPRSRVWRALTDATEFGRWFRAEMKDRFAPGAPARGRITYPGYEHLTFEVRVERMEPERLFSFRGTPMRSIRSRITRRSQPRWWCSSLRRSRKAPA
jgi:uncharacterized protein YndB with AHSA1/START domain